MHISCDSETWQREDIAGGSQGRRWRDTSRRRRRCRYRVGRGGTAWLWMLVVVVLLLVSPVRAVLLDFDNCLDESIVNSSPLQLQFVPLDVDVTFDLVDPLHPLNITVYGNVSGTADQSSSYPSPDDPLWLDPTNSVGKIEDLDVDNNKYSTLLKSVEVVSFTPYSDAARFCDSVTQGDCPLGPVFYANV